MYPKKILVKILKDLWQIKYRSMAIIATIAISAGIYIGTHTALQSINGTCAQLYKELHLSDIQFNFIPTTEDELPKEAEAIKGIERFEKRLILPGNIETKEDKLIATLLIILDKDRKAQVNQLKIIDGSYFKPGDRNCVLLDYSFAKEHGYHVGDKISLGLQGFFSKVKITGLAVNAEHLVTSANPDFYMPVKNSLGIAYLPMRTIKELFGYRIYNNFSLTCRQGADPQTVKTSFDKLFIDHDLELDSVFFQDDLFSVKVIRRDMRSFFMVLPAIVGVFILVSFLILFFSLSRMIQQDTPQLGALLALGFSPLHLFSAYVSGAAVLGLIGYILGCAGSNFLAALIVNSYMAGTGLPLIFRYYNWHSFLIAFLFSLGAPMIAAALPLLRMRKKNIAEMLGRTIEKPWYFKKNILGVFWPALGDKLFEKAIILKIGVRNLWRRKIFFILSILGIILGIALAEALFITNASIYRTVDDFFTLEKWDLFVPFSGLVDRTKAETLKKIKGISQVSLYKKGLVTLQFGDKKKPYQIAGISLKNSLIRPSIIEGSFFSSNESNEIILNAEMKDRYSLKIGDPIEVWAGNKPKARLRLVGVMNNFMIGQAFVPIKAAQRITGKIGRFTGAFMALSAPFEQVQNSLRKLDFVGYIVRKSEAHETFNTNMKKISTFLYTYSLMSIFLSICIIFVNLYLNIVYRKSEYAVLLANGFGRREIGLMIIYEILAIITTVIVATIPLTVLISKFFCYKIAKTAVIITLQIRALDYLKVFVPMIFLMAAVAWYCIRYVSSIDITGTMRNRIDG